MKDDTKHCEDTMEHRGNSVHPLEHMRVALVVANEGVEEVELLHLWRSVVNAGGRAEVVAPLPGFVETMHDLDRGDRFPVDQVTDWARQEDYDAAVLPGGVVNPDRLRTDAAAVDFLMSLFEAGKPVGGICHGPLTLIDGDLVAGRTVTSSPSIRSDLRNARAHWVDEPVVVCERGINTLVTGRRRSDLPAFCERITEVFAPADALV